MGREEREENQRKELKSKLRYYNPIFSFLIFSAVYWCQGVYQKDNLFCHLRESVDLSLVDLMMSFLSRAFG